MNLLVSGVYIGTEGAEVSIDLQVCLCLVVDLDLTVPLALTVRLCLMVVDGVMG